MIVQINDHLQSRSVDSATAGLDVLVNSAGLIGGGSVENVSISHFYAMFEVNVFAVLGLMQGLTPVIKKVRGSIMNISSIPSLKSFPS